MSDDNKTDPEKTTQWKTRVESFVCEYQKDGHAYASAVVTSSTRFNGETQWRWEVQDNTYQKMKARGEGFTDADEAKTSALRALELIGDLTQLGTFIVEREVPTDKVDMVHVIDKDMGLGGCVLCGRSDIQCLHDPAEVRLALFLAMKLGRHQPKESP